MKNRPLPLRLIAAFSGLFLLFSTTVGWAGQPVNPNSRNNNGSWLESIRINQLTGQVNPMDVYLAGQQAEAMKVKSTSGAMGLNWLPVGPDNYPGLVWSVIFDNTDPTGNTIIAGAESGGVWKSVNLGLSWTQMAVEASLVLKVSSLVQVAGGTIYAATGVTSCKTVKFDGGGIYRTGTNGEFALISSTYGQADFKGVSKLALHEPSGRIYAGTYGGLYYSDNGDVWTKILNGYTMDVCVAADGTVITAIGDSAYLAPGGDFSALVTLTTGNENALPKTGIGWMTFAIAPSDPNVIYASLAGTNGKLLNIYLSEDKGSTWRVVFPSNPTFEPFGTGYGCYSNTLTVYPNDPYQLFLGGTNMWYGKRVNSTGFYNWEQVSFGSFGVYSPYFSPLYHHDYTFNPKNSNQLIMATDGGVSLADISVNGVTFQTSNKNLQTSQFNALSFSAQKGFVMGGGDRIGTLALGYFYPSAVNAPSAGYQINRRDASALSDDAQPQPANYCGNGGTSVWSNIDPNVAVYTKFKGDSTSEIPYKAIRRQDFRDIYKSNYFMGGLDTVSSARVPMCLWETFNQQQAFGITRDSVKVHADQKAIPADTTILVPSGSNRVPFPYHTLAQISKGDSITVADPLATRYFLYAKKSTKNGIYMTVNMLKFDKPINYFLLFQDAIATDPVTAMAISANLNTLWAGTSNGRLIRITGILNAYDSATANITSSQCVVVDTVYVNTPFTGRTVTSVSINPANPDLVMVTLGNYGNQDYVYYSKNAGSTAPTFVSVQSNLPKTVVYSGLLEMSSNNNAILGTDLGVFTTTGLNSAAPQWTPDMQNLGNVPVTDIRQQVMRDYHIQNYGMIYLASYGRGIWMDTTYATPVGIEPEPGMIRAHGDLKINPNPVIDNLTVSYMNEKSGSLSFTVYDLTGRIVMNETLGNQPKGLFTRTFNLGSLTQGTYLVKIGTDSGKIVKL